MFQARPPRRAASITIPAGINKKMHFDNGDLWACSVHGPSTYDGTLPIFYSAFLWLPSNRPFYTLSINMFILWNKNLLIENWWLCVCVLCAVCVWHIANAFGYTNVCGCMHTAQWVNILRHVNISMRFVRCECMGCASIVSQFSVLRSLHMLVYSQRW